MRASRPVKQNVLRQVSECVEETNRIKAFNRNWETLEEKERFSNVIRDQRKTLPRKKREDHNQLDLLDLLVQQSPMQKEMNDNCFKFTSILSSFRVVAASTAEPACIRGCHVQVRGCNGVSDSTVPVGTTSTLPRY